MSTKKLFHAFHDYFSMRAGEPVDAFINDADWNVSERSATPNALISNGVLNAAMENCGAGEKFLIKTLVECSGSLVWHTRQFGDVQIKFVELIGPKGHFPSAEIAGGIMLIEPNTQLPEYYIMAEELLVPLNDGGSFRMDKEAFALQKSGTVLFHESAERRSVKSGDTPLLVAYVWRDGDLNAQVET